MIVALGIADDGSENTGEDWTHDGRDEHGGDEHHGAVLDESHEGDHGSQHQEHQEVKGELGIRFRIFKDYQNSTKCKIYTKRCVLKGED